MPKLTDQVRTEIRTKFAGRDDIEVIKHPRYDDQAVARPPTDGEYRIFRQKLASPEEAALANDMLIDACVLWPDKDAREKLFGQRPALRDVWAGEIIEMAGATRQATREKL